MATNKQDCCPAQGSDSVYLVEPGNGVGTFDTNSERYRFETFRLKPDKLLRITEATLGARQRFVTQATQDVTQLVGTIGLRPSRADFDFWWPRIIGGVKGADNQGYTDITATVNHIVPDGSVPRFSIRHDTGGAGIFEYYDCQVAVARLSGRTGENMLLEMDITARTFDDTKADSTPNVALGNDPEDEQSIFSALRLILEEEVPAGADNNELCFADSLLTINNSIDSRFYNYETAQCVTEGQRIINGRLGLPWNSAMRQKVYGLGNLGVSAQLGLVSSDDMDMQIYLGALKWPDRGPEAENLSDLSYGIDFEVFAPSATTPDIYVVNDSDSSS